MKLYAVIFSHPNNIGLDGYDGLNPDGPYPAKAVFTTRHEAEEYADRRAAALPGCAFTVVEVEA